MLCVTYFSINVNINISKTKDRSHVNYWFRKRCRKQSPYGKVEQLIVKKIHVPSAFLGVYHDEKELSARMDELSIAFKKAQS